MILELGGFVLLGSMSILARDILSKAKKDQQKIEHVFRNAKVCVHTGQGIKDIVRYPKLIRKEKFDWGISYVYRLPLGMSYEDISKVKHLIDSALNKDVEIADTGVIHIRVPKQATPEKVAYKDVVEACKGWEIPIGESAFGLVKHDFDKIPHMTVGGLTRYGKTVLLKLITTTIVKNNPDAVKLHFYDLKGGLEFHNYEKIKQTVSVSSNIEQSLENLRAIKNDIENKLAYFRVANITNIVESSIPERNFVFVDEGAELTPHGDKQTKQMLAECQNILSYIARIGGALGYRLIYCTQYPTGDTLPRQIKQNADAKVAFRVPTQVASRVCIDAYGAEELPHKHPGRAIFKTDKFEVIQVPYDKDFYQYVKEYEVKGDDVEHREEQTTRRSDSVVFGEVGVS